MKTIWKYELKIADEQIIKMPAHAEFLTVQLQRFRPCLWALVEDTHTQREHRIQTIGTGHQIGRLAAHYIGTYQTVDELVFHVFGEEA